MKDLQSDIESLVTAAAEASLGETIEDPLLRPAKDAKHGDYQANLALSLAKRLGRAPREIAEAVAAQLKIMPQSREMLTAVEIAGPGFLNLTLRDEYLAARLSQALSDPRLGVPPASDQVVVVDYSGPNVAKEMHVGHLRSTIIGDAICRVLSFYGDRVIRQNHLGDWGTQFGMLIEYLLESGWGAGTTTSISDLDLLYQQAKQRFDQDDTFAERARERVVKLQAGEETSRRIWQQLVDESKRHMELVYDRLMVLLSDDDVRPESFYNDRLHAVVTDLTALGLLVEDQGAKVVFPEGMHNKEGQPLPLFVQKSDGGFGYATTDLAAARYRAQDLGATRIIYVVDSRQADHFKMLFWTLRAAQWAEESQVSLEHVGFGTILGEDRKPFKTRSGGTVKLIGLLDEATKRAEGVIAEKNPELNADERHEIAHAVGIGAVKYADLSSERIKDYAFDYERMLAFEGNTAPYLQYAYVRIQSIFRKGEVTQEQAASYSPTLSHARERELALHVLKLPRVIESVARSLEPHRLCNYLYELASYFHAFHHDCRVLNADTDVERQSRLALCALVAKNLELGLSLLGISAIKRM